MHYPVLRQQVREALNRGEAYHQLRRFLAFANNGCFRGSSENELAIWNECARLLANAIIFYNASLLSAVADKYTGEDKEVRLDLLKRISPLSWLHINVQGRFEFNLDVLPLDIAAMVANAEI